MFFDLPIDVIKERLENNRIGQDRDYLDGKQDIHEKSLDLQSKVRKIYLGLTELKNYKIINCLDNKGKVLTPIELFNTYIELMK